MDRVVKARLAQSCVGKMLLFIIHSPKCHDSWERAFNLKSGLSLDHFILHVLFMIGCDVNRELFQHQVCVHRDHLEDLGVHTLPPSCSTCPSMESMSLQGLAGCMRSLMNSIHSFFFLLLTEPHLVLTSIFPPPRHGPQVQGWPPWNVDYSVFFASS